MANADAAHTDELDRESPTPYYSQIADRLLDEIETAHVQPGYKVASEASLAARFGVSRMTVRKAVLQLTAKGYLARRERSGTYVARPRLAHGISTEDSFSASMLATGHRVETEVLEAGRGPADHRTARVLGLSTGDEVVIVRRLRKVDGDPVAIHETHLPTRFAVVLDHDLTRSLTDILRVVGAGSERSVDAVDASNADDDTAELLGTQMGTPLMRVEGEGYGPDGEPVRRTISIYRGDRFRIAVEGTGSPMGIELLPRGGQSS